MKSSASNMLLVYDALTASTSLLSTSLATQTQTSSLNLGFGLIYRS